MKETHLIKFCCLILFLANLCLGALNLSAEEKVAKEEPGQKTESALCMPLLTGNLWQQMSQDCKISFLWGFGHVVTIEQELMQRFPDLKRESFVTKAAEGMSGVPMNNIVRDIDNFYKSNPDQLDKPVTDVIWDLEIKPKIKTGIDNRPLQ